MLSHLLTLQSLPFFKIEAQQKISAKAVLNLHNKFDWEAVLT